MPDQIPFGTDQFGAGLEFAENPEQRCPCLLLLDTSGSMGGKPISELNDGIALFKSELLADSLAAKRVEVAVITFGGEVKTVCEFVSPPIFNPPALNAGGDTPMGLAILRGTEMIRKRKDEYRAHGVPYYRPWLFLITDGAPTDDWHLAADEVKSGESQKAFSFFAAGVEGADFETLAQIAVRKPLSLRGLKFRELFLWLSKSMQSVSRSQPGDAVSLPSPSGWASV